LNAVITQSQEKGTVAEASGLAWGKSRLRDGQEVGAAIGTPLFLQRQAQTVPRAIMKTKLTIGQPGDDYEQEADRVAEQVMRMPESTDLGEEVTDQSGANPTISSAGPHIRSLSPNLPGLSVAVPSSVDKALASPSTPMGSALQQDMERRFGQDFSDVRVHTGKEAEDSAQEVSAAAYTVGHDIVFGEGQYFPDSHQGRKLISHELTHVLQQTEMGLSPYVARQTTSPPIWHTQALQEISRFAGPSDGKSADHKWLEMVTFLCKLKPGKARSLLQRFRGSDSFADYMRDKFPKNHERLLYALESIGNGFTPEECQSSIPKTNFGLDFETERNEEQPPRAECEGEKCKNPDSVTSLIYGTSCTPYPSKREALDVWNNMSTILPAGVYAATGSSTNALIWWKYLHGGGAMHFDSLQNFDDPLVVAVRTSEDQVPNAIYNIINYVEKNLSAFGKTFLKGNDTQIGIDIVDYVPDFLLAPRLEWVETFNPAANVIGQIGDSKSYGPDYRQISGTLTLYKQRRHGDRLTVDVRASVDLTIKIVDTVDFCPGAIGFPHVRHFTIPLSRLEASGLTHPVHLSVYLYENRSTGLVNMRDPDVEG